METDMAITTVTILHHHTTIARAILIVVGLLLWFAVNITSIYLLPSKQRTKQFLILGNQPVKFFLLPSTNPPNCFLFLLPVTNKRTYLFLRPSSN